MKSHTFLAISVLLAAGVWIATGKYSFVGSATGDAHGKAEAATPAPEQTSAAPAKAPQTVAFVKAKNTQYQRKIRIAGVTEADKSTVLAARTAGVIDRVTVDKGARVAKDDLIMALDGPEKYSAVRAAEALVEQRAKQAAVDQDLLQRGKIAPLKADASQSDLAAARSSLEAARAEVDRMELRAPFAGIVDDVMVETGSWVQPGAEVASVIALDPIVAVGEVSERDLRYVSVGAKAEVDFADGTVADGTIRFIRREASNLTRTFPIEVAVANADFAIPSGMSAAITISASGEPSVTVPRSIVTLGADGSIGVRKLESDDTVSFLKANVVDDTPEGLVITGIPDGTRVIVSGQDLVTDGQKVKAVDATAAAAAYSTGGTN